MKEHLPILIVAIPACVALLAPLIAFLSIWLLRCSVIGSLLISHICAVITLVEVLSNGMWRYWFGGWEPPWGIEYVIDPLGAGMAVLITFISFVVSIYSGPFFKDDASWLRKGMIYSLYCLVTIGLTGIVLTGDVFNLYVFLEIASLSTYALVASGGPKAAVSAFYYILVGTIGASLYLLGIGYLYAVTGSLNMADLVQLLPPLMHSPAVMTAIVMLVVGLGIKMALFPLHGWLPDVYTYAPPPITALISSIMTKVFAYVLLRLLFFIFGPAFGPIPAVLQIIGLAAAIGIIAASVMAIGQKDFRRMLAYSSVAQIGYIVVGLSIGNTLALTGAILHILNHSFMKCCLFMVAGGIKWKTGEHAIDKYTELGKRLPLTMGAFLIAAISMVGLPPTAGFFSKWYLAQGALAAGLWPYVIVIIVSSLLNAVYFFRVIEQVYLKKRDPAEPVETKVPQDRQCRWELPVSILVPVVLMGVGILVVGIFNEPIVTQVLLHAIPGGGQ